MQRAQVMVKGQWDWYSNSTQLVMKSTGPMLLADVRRAWLVNSILEATILYISTSLDVKKCLDRAKT